ncbi:FAD-dependent pyridine nucleotide-disulphide oxidoreductase [Desulfitobacterium hafniense DCB-2]|uniref:FAD-dependent pyridine nucleotide-disulphide oxidoreductase n=1 Tax=Desulfitobacterium hafniense (strain DSM 10664 / DCB-2) TaxID=272564 RepID=B8G1C4_DESHD|nr:FAD-dependent oxidoreductase [Desulfitobacterium hafniense]ACL21177.1 FAD-dependent pyridine nucleotide-disulphide oxidoreductase [Desulfitobacterium hafniense DCB-2]
MHYVIIGNSAAGVFAAEALRGLDSSGKITMISEENNRPYSRCLTSYYIGEEIDQDRIYIRDANFYAATGIDFIPQKVEQVNDTEKSITLQSGEIVGYDKLLIATGASPYSLPVEGLDLEGVCELRTLEDARRIMDFAPHVKEAVVMGAGLVGLKGAHALHELGIKVSIIVNSRIMSRSVDPHTGQIITELLEQDGYEVIYNTKLSKILGQDKVEGVCLSSGKEIPCQLVLMAAGVSPNVDLVKNTGIEVNKGIIVDKHMQTTVSHIYAAGDVAEAYHAVWDEKRVISIWPVATAQGTVAGSNMAGVERIYEGSVGSNSAVFCGVGVVSAGIPYLPTGEGQELSTYDKATKRYRKFIVKDDILVGMIMVGDIDGAGILTAMIKQKTKVSLDTLNYWLNHPVRFQGYCTAEAKGGIVCGIC